MLQKSALLDSPVWEQFVVAAAPRVVLLRLLPQLRQRQLKQHLKHQLKQQHQQLQQRQQHQQKWQPLNLQHSMPRRLSR